MGSLIHKFVSRLKGISSEDINRLLFLFGLVYFSQGIAQAGGLINQPLMRFLEKVHGLDAPQATALLGVLTIPWMIKPLYGLITDFIPLLGYRRKTWLVVMNAVACLGFICLFNVSGLSTVVLLLSLTAIGTAASDVIVDALMVENGQRFNATGKFQAIQWTFFFIAMSIASYFGGYLATRFEAEPLRALQIAALITAAAPALVILSTWFVVKEEKVTGGKELIPYLASLVVALATIAALAWYLAPNSILGSCLCVGAALITMAAGCMFTKECAQLTNRQNGIVLCVGIAVSAVAFYLSGQSFAAGIIIGASLTLLMVLGIYASVASCWAILRRGSFKGFNSGLASTYNRLSQNSRVSFLWAALGSITLVFACIYAAVLAPHAMAAVISMTATLIVLGIGWTIYTMTCKPDLRQLIATSEGLREASRSKTLWVVALFLCFWNFSPSFGATLYYYVTDKKGPIGFSDEFWGQLSSIESISSLVGCIIFFAWFRKLRLKTQLVCAITLGVVSTLAAYYIVTPNPYIKTVAVVQFAIFGATGMISTLSMMTLASQACPKKAEGFTFAILVSLWNGMKTLSGIVGASMYEYWFDKNFVPLILVSAGFTALCFLGVPFLGGVKEADALK